MSDPSATITLMPKCLDCNNDKKFYVPVYGYDIFYIRPDGGADIESEYTEVEPDAPVKCGECESTNIQDKEYF